MKTILLSTPTTPYPIQPWHDSATDISRQRQTKGQGIFTNEGHVHLLGPFVIAQNLSVPCTVLDFPTVENWVEEIKKGYDYVGISSLTPNLECVMDMCRLVRRYAPDSQIVVGGFVTASINTFYPESEWRKLIDHLVLGDGVRWFRELIGDNADEPVRQHFLPKMSSGKWPWIDRNPVGTTAPMVAALGCIRKCDFCITTAHFGGKRHEFASAEVLVEEMKMWQKRAPGTRFMLYEEDQDKRYLDELGRLLRADPEIDMAQTGISILISINTLSKFKSLEDLRYNGVANCFIGMESKFAASEGGYRKSRGAEPRDIIRGLMDVGVGNCIGWMAGFDFHDRERLEEDFQYLLECQPMSAQLTRVTPYPGTPLYERLEKEGRIRPYKWEEVTFYGGGMVHNNLYEHEIMEFIRNGDERMLHTLGPTGLRAVNVHFNGYEKYKDRDDESWSQIADYHRRVAYNSFPIIAPMERFAPNGRIRRMVHELEQRWRMHFGEPSTEFKIQSKFAEIKATAATLREKVNPQNRQIKIPPAKRYHFFGADIKDDGSLPYRKEYLNENPEYIRDTKLQNAEQALLNVALAAGRQLDDAESNLQQPAKELREDAGNLLMGLADNLRKPHFDLTKALMDMKWQALSLAIKAIAVGEDPDNGIDAEVKKAKKSVAVLIEHYADQLKGGNTLKKLATHPPLRDYAKPVLETVVESLTGFYP